MKTIREEDLFYPQRTEQEPDSELLKNVTVVTKDSVRIKGWYLSRSGNPIDMLYFYGNGESVRSSRHRLLWLMETFGVNIVAFDYRGYGISEGTPTLENILNDGLEIYDKYREITGSTASRTVVYGRSIGTVAALAIASKRNITGLILEAPLTTASEVIRSWRKQIPLFLKWLIVFRPERSLILMNPQPIDYAKEVTCPLLVIHGADDRIIPITLGRKIHDCAAATTKMFCEVPNVGHNDLRLTDPKTKEAIASFFKAIE